jgi:hypothetical protein
MIIIIERNHSDLVIVYGVTDRVETDLRSRSASLVCVNRVWPLCTGPRWLHGRRLRREKFDEFFDSCGSPLPSFQSEVRAVERDRSGEANEGAGQRGRIDLKRRR